MAEEMSKSAKKRAAKKNRDAAGEEESPAPVSVPAPAAPKSKAAAKSAPAAAVPVAKVATAPAEAAPKGKAKAKAEAKAAPEPKASAKGAAKSLPTPAAAEPAATGKKKKGGAESIPAPAASAVPAAQPATKAAAKGKAKAKAAPAPPPVPEPPVDPFIVMDDGTGGDWDVAAAITKKGKKKDKTDDVPEAETKPKGPLYKTAESASQPKGKGAEKGGGKRSGDAAPVYTGSKAMEALTKSVQAEAAARVAAQARPKAAEGEKADEPKVPQFSRTVEMPGDKIGRVIGPKGANIMKIQEHFEGKINRIDTSGGFCTITGEDEKAVESAEMAIKELINKGFMSISYKDLKEDTVTVKSMFLPEIIGKQGAIIKKIKEVTNVEIDIPQEGKGGKGASALDEDAKGKGKGGKGNEGKPVKIALVGEAADVATAKAIIEDICKNFCHPLIHVDHVHAAMEVDPDNHRYIIGRGGSEMRHIQKNWNVKVNLPKWDYDGTLLSESENVIVVGEQHDVDRAKAYIEKTLSSALEDNKKFAEGAPAPKEDKYDKDEEPVEAWMKPYMYKR